MTQSPVVLVNELCQNFRFRLSVHSLWRDAVRGSKPRAQTKVTHIYILYTHIRQQQQKTYNKRHENGDLSASRLVSMDLVMRQAMLREPYPPNARADQFRILNRDAVSVKEEYEVHGGATEDILARLTTSPLKVDFKRDARCGTSQHKKEKKGQPPLQVRGIYKKKEGEGRRGMRRKTTVVARGQVPGTKARKEKKEREKRIKGPSLPTQWTLTSTYFLIKLKVCTAQTTAKLKRNQNWTSDPKDWTEH